MKDKEKKALISLLDDEDPQVISMVTSKISELGTGMIPLLEQEWEESFNPLVQKRIEDLTHELQFTQVKERLTAWRDQEKQDLLEGMWIVNTYQYPDVELIKLRQEIDQIFYEVWVNFRPYLHPYDQIKILNGIIFYDLKFSGNTKNFHSPSNSFLNIVLETRKGNPLSLCVIYLLIAQKLNLPVFGVNLPNLFLLGYNDPRFPAFYINAYNKGLLFSRDDLENYVKELQLQPQDSFFEECPSIEIVKRALRNLLTAYEKAGEREKMSEISQLSEILETESNTLNF